MDAKMMFGKSAAGAALIAGLLVAGCTKSTTNPIPVQVPQVVVMDADMVACIAVHWGEPFLQVSQECSVPTDLVDSALLIWQAANNSADAGAHD